MSYFLALVGKDDKPLYELEFGPAGRQTEVVFPPSVRDLTPYIVHASLDVVDEVQWTSPQLFFKAVDKFYGYTISAFVTPGNVRFLLLHLSKNEDAIKQFFMEVWDAYVKTRLSPFFVEGEPIKSLHFDARIKSATKRLY